MTPNASMHGSRGRVFIAGAGLAGCTFARILADAGYDVIIADAGGQHSRLPGENLKNFHNYQVDVDQFGAVVRGLMHAVSVPPHQGLPYTRNALNPRQNPDTNLPGAVVAYAVGGMAVHWTCAIPRQHRSERGDFLADDEWNELLAEAEQLMNLHADVRHGSLRHRVIKRHLAERGVDTNDTPLAAERRGDEFVYHTGADTVLGELAEPRGSARLTLLAEHRVSRLEHDGAKITSVSVRDMRTKQEHRIEADVYIVAAGWLHSAQILWASDIANDAEGALGRYLHDHLFTACQVVLSDDIIAKIRAEAGASAAGTGSDPIPIPMSDPAPHLYVPVTDERQWHGMIFREAFQFDPKAPIVDSRLIVDLKWFGMIDTVRTNRVTFEPDIFDRYGMPQPTFDFRLSENDRRRQAEMMTHMTEVARLLGGYLPDRNGNESQPIVVPLGASTHTMGATRMGTDPATSVVDTNSKVWDFENLFVGGNCVLPTSNACNPTLASIALAVKAARHIASGAWRGGSGATGERASRDATSPVQQGAD